MPLPRVRALLASSLVIVGQLTAVDADWPQYGGSPANNHYSRLSQINRDNVAHLKVAWQFDSGDAFPGSEIECNPIVVGGKLFATTPSLHVVALDAVTGQQLWNFDPNEGRPVRVKMRNRGVTYANGRVYVTVRQYLYALDAATGKPVADFGRDGRIDLRENLGRAPEQQTVSALTPPVFFDGLLIIGSIVSETLPASPGDVRAYDAANGQLRWTFHTIPHPGEFGYKTWPADAWQYSGGVNSWSGLTLDPKRGIVYVPLGSATFDFYGSNRIGDDLFANCLLALNARTGKRIWHYQTVHHDLWDRDLPAPPALVTVQRNGKTVDAVAQVTKSGFTFVLDRDTGKPLFPVQERAFPPSDVDGEKAAETQPIPVLPQPFARQRVTEDLITKRTPEAHEEALARFRQLRSNGPYIPPSFAGTVHFPGMDGGAEWGGPSFDPDTGLLYVNANEMPWVIRLVPKKSSALAHNGEELYQSQCAGCHRPDRAGAPPEFPSLLKVGDHLTDDEITRMIQQGGGRMPAFNQLPHDSVQALVRFIAHNESVATTTSDATASPMNQKYGIDGYNRFLDKDGYPAVTPPWGTLTAIDLNSGAMRWQIPLGEYPELAAKGLTNTGSENYGGSIVTENGLLFIAASSFDRKIRAFDKVTGAQLWEAKLPFAGNATPALYQVNGREYLVIACGGGKSKDPTGAMYVAFALPEAGSTTTTAGVRITPAASEIKAQR